LSRGEDEDADAADFIARAGSHRRGDRRAEPARESLPNLKRDPVTGEYRPVR
jgi:hypothetical protein